MADNRGMLTVFKRAGFDLRRTGSFGEVVVSLDIRPTEAVRERIEARDHRAAVASLRPILAPQSIALVIGSSEPDGAGAAVLANIVADGFTGVVTPVGRSGGVLRSMRVVPQPVGARRGPRARGDRRARGGGARSASEAASGARRR